MKILIDNLNKLRVAGLLVLGALVINLTVQGQTTGTSDPVGFIARAATYLVTAPLATEQVQTLNAKNFYQLPPSLRPLYLHALAFQIGHIVAADAALPGDALEEYLRIVDQAELDLLFIYMLPDQNEAIIVEALRTVNVLIANQIAGSAALRQAVQSGAVKGYISWNEGDWNGDLTPPTGGSGSLVDDILQGL